MRTIGIILLAATALSCASSLPPAEPSNNMMEEADRVILAIDEDPERAYRNLSQHLIDKGFEIKKSDTGSLELQTGFQEFGPIVMGVLGSYSMRIFSSVKDTVIYFNAELSSGTEVENNGGKTSPVRSGWRKLVEIAKDFPHKKIYYSRN